MCVDNKGIGDDKRVNNIWSSNKARNLELAIGVITLIFIAWQSSITATQARHTAENVKLIKKSVELNEHKLINKHLQSINTILINPEASDDFYKNYAKNREQILSFMFLADYEMFFEMATNQVISKRSWCRVYGYISLVVENDENFRKVWEKNEGRGNSKEFKEFIDCLMENGEEQKCPVFKKSKNRVDSDEIYEKSIICPI